MTTLDALIPFPRLLQIDHADVAVPPELAWQRVRELDLMRSPLIRGLFGLRTLPDRLRGKPPMPSRVTVLDLAASEEPGFRVLADGPGMEITLGAIGKVWETNIPFADVSDVESFASFAEPEHAKVAWTLSVEPRGEAASRIVMELRVTTTDDASWTKFRRYFALIGPFSHLMRRHLLAMLRRELGAPEDRLEERFLAGDELLPDAGAQVTDGITIAASPDAIWPWLVQMGCRRGGWYSWDVLDNASTPSAREIHPDLQQIAVGDRLPATPDDDAGFQVLRVDEGRALVLGGLFDAGAGQTLDFRDERPERYWHVTWSFVLEPLSSDETRLHVRARVAFPPSGRLHLAWGMIAHHIMEARQLRNLAARAEGRLPRDSARDVASGLVGAAGIVVDFLTPFLRGVRNHWGLDRATAERAYPGDELVPEPRFVWTHGVEIDAPPSDVWPWVAQIGADRGGFYSYQWLENLVGCDVKNAERIHPEWELREGDALRLHPRMPPLEIVEVERGRAIVAHGRPDERARAEGRPWVSVTWLFFVEPLPGGRSRFISRFRSDTSDDFAHRVQYSPYLTESIGFVMDRKMLLGVKERVERAARDLERVERSSGEQPAQPLEP